MRTDESNIFYRGKFHSGTLSFSNGLIDGIEILGRPKQGLLKILPGFVDIHVHGSCGSDFLSGADAYERVSKCLPANGVTSFMPTLAAAPAETMLSSLRRFASARLDGAAALNAHLEGPFINPLRRGAQNPEFMRLPDTEELKRLVEASGRRIGLVTVAPELEGARELIEYCVGKGIRCSIGHTDATYLQALESFTWGATIVNHSFNAMRPLHHREPGVVGAMLLSEGIFCELIADGVHVGEAAVKLLTENVGADHIVLVTDGIIAQNSGDGEYTTEAFRFQVRDGVARLKDGTLAGSTLTMDRALKNMMSMASLDLKDVVPMLTSIPCRAVGVEDRGEIEKGKRADLTYVDDELRVVKTYVAGRLVHEL